MSSSLERTVAIQSTRGLGFVFLLIATPFLGFGGYLLSDSIDFSGQSVEVISAVTEVSTETCETRREKNHRTVYHRYTCYRPTVAYTFEGRSYSKVLNSTSSGRYKIGETFKLQLDPKNPSEARWPADLWLPVAFLLGFGGVIGAIGCAFVVFNPIRRNSLEERLRRRGQRVRAKVIEVREDSRIRISGRHPFIVRAQFTDPRSGRLITAQATSVMIDPRLTGDIDAEGCVEVLYDPIASDKCIIDLLPLSFVS